jgi:DNA-binding transcriptional MerR regulator
MAYTVKKLAALSGVSVRTLHFYDEAGLLTPAYHGANGYRYYEEEQLLRLQQILFYRELGFELKQIQRILDRSDFDKVAALREHRKALQANLRRSRRLIETIDKTINHLEGNKSMKTGEMFAGFSPEQQAQHEQYLVERFGEGAKQGIAESKKRVQGWSQRDWEQSGTEFNAICQEFVALLQRRKPAGSVEAQAVARRHYEWIRQFWTPTRISYAGHSQMIADSELRKAYEAHHADLPQFAAAAIQTFAERELD